MSDVINSNIPEDLFWISEWKEGDTCFPVSTSNGLGIDVHSKVIFKGIQGSKILYKVVIGQQVFLRVLNITTFVSRFVNLSYETRSVNKLLMIEGQ